MVAVHVKTANTLGEKLTRKLPRMSRLTGNLTSLKVMFPRASFLSKGRTIAVAHQGTLAALESVLHRNVAQDLNVVHVLSVECVQKVKGIAAWTVRSVRKTLLCPFPLIMWTLH